MKLAVCVKHAVDESELKSDSSGTPLLKGAISKMSTFDKNAVEEALRIRSAAGGEIVAVTVGGAESRKTLKEALAMGVDRAIHVVAEPDSVDSFLTSALLAKAIQKHGPFDVVLCSEGSSDTYTGQVPPMLAEHLGVAYAGYARKLELGGSSATVERSLEERVEVVECPLPVLVSVVSEINEPRYPTLIQIMQASKKPVEEATPDQLGLGGVHAKTRVLSMSTQSMKRKRVMLDGTPEEASTKLVEALAKEGVLS